MGQIFYYSQIGENLLPTTLSFGVAITTVAIYFAVMVAFYLLRSIGLFVLAKHNKINRAWMAFIPFVWIYVAVMLIKDNNFFGKPYKNFAIIFTVIFAVYQVINLVFNVLVYLPLVGYYFMGGTIYLGTITESLAAELNLVEYWYGEYYVQSDLVYPYVNMISMINVLRIVNQVVNVLYWAVFVIEINLYFSLFRKFWPNHYLLAAILSIFLGLFPVFMFVIRHKEPVNYREYVNSRQNYYGPRYYGGMHGQNPYGNGNPYGNNNPYGNPHANPYGQPNQNSNDKSSEPFGEFNEKDDSEPFPEFDNRKDN